jgi:hypothetical protein
MVAATKISLLLLIVAYFLVAAVVAQDPTSYIAVYPARSVVGAVPHLTTLFFSIRDINSVAGQKK